VYVDRQNLKDSSAWIALSALILLGCTAGYGIYVARASVRGPSGGSWQGVGFGAFGTALIVSGFLLTLRKRYREKRWGRVYLWLQGHIWLGLISLPIILYHAGGFRLGGDVSAVLMVLFYFCYFSGVAGLLLQHFLPRWMLDNVRHETIYDEIDHVARENLRTARRLIRARAPSSAAVAYDEELKAVPLSAEQLERERAAADVREFYDKRVRPYLAWQLRPAPPWRWIVRRYGWKNALRRSSAVLPPGEGEFTALRQKLPRDQFDLLDQLRNLVEQRRQFDQQKRLHWVLHGWLLIHVPASWAMLLLIPVHAVVALRYAAG
jgi:hypothetical protein